MAFADLNDEQLVHKVLEIERELVRAQFKHSMNQLENTSKLRVLRHDIARLRTEARARETAAGLHKNELLARHRKTFAEKAVAASQGAAPVAASPERGGFLSGIVDKLSGKE
jgi:large subunit ribosomal protein L29